MKDQLLNSIKGIQSDNDKVREKHFNFLLPLSEKKPELLYVYWDIFISMLRKPEVSNKYYAIHLLANIIIADRANKFDDLFNEYYELLNHESPVVSAHIAGKSGKIIRAKPQYEAQIVQLLLDIDKTSKCRHIELQKAYVIEAFNEAFDIISQKSKIINYAKKLLNSKSLRTRKAAKAFLLQRNK